MQKSDVIKKAHTLGFDDIGFASAEPYDSQKEILKARKEEYAWACEKGNNLKRGLDPKNILHDAKSVMIAWALGRIGGEKSKTALETFLLDSDGIVHEEIGCALEKF